VRSRIELIGPSDGLAAPRLTAAYVSNRLSDVAASSASAVRSAGIDGTHVLMEGGIDDRYGPEAAAIADRLAIPWDSATQ